MFDYSTSASLSEVCTILAVVAGIVGGAIMLAFIVETVRYLTTHEHEDDAAFDTYKANIKRLGLFAIGVSALAMPKVGEQAFSFFSQTTTEDALKQNAAKATDYQTALTPSNPQWATTVIGQIAAGAANSNSAWSGTTGAAESSLRSQLVGALTDPNNASQMDVINAAQAIASSDAYAQKGSSLTNEDIKADAALVAKLEQYGAVNLDDPGLVSATWLGCSQAIEDLDHSLGIFDFTDPDKTYLDYAGWFSGRY